MTSKPNTRNWNDVQTAIAAIAVVTTLGLWNLFAIPSKTEVTKTSEPVIPPPTEPPVEQVPAVMPQVKIMFTQTAPQPIVVQQTQQKKKKKDKNNNNNNGGGGTVTQTKTS